jgi:predicted lactoylglutathione lyase
MSKNKQPKAIVGHVVIEITDLKKSKKFYTTLLSKLSFKIILENEGGVGFSNQNFQVWIGQAEKPRVKRKAPTGEENVILDHLAILVANRETVDTIEREMKEKGFDPLFPCEEHPQFEPGYYAVSFLDPDNFVVEVYTRSKPKKFW